MEGSWITPAAPDWPGEKARVQRLRRGATKLGLRVQKSHKVLSLDNYSGYFLVDAARNTVVAGERYDLSADALAEILKGMDGNPEYESVVDIITPIGKRLGDCRKADLKRSMEMYAEQVGAHQPTAEVFEHLARAHQDTVPAHLGGLPGEGAVGDRRSVVPAGVRLRIPRDRRSGISLRRH